LRSLAASDVPAAKVRIGPLPAPADRVEERNLQLFRAMLAGTRRGHSWQCRQRWQVRAARCQCLAEVDVAVLAWAAWPHRLRVVPIDPIELVGGEEQTVSPACIRTMGRRSGEPTEKPLRRMWRAPEGYAGKGGVKFFLAGLPPASSSFVAGAPSESQNGSASLSIGLPPVPIGRVLCVGDGIGAGATAWAVSSGLGLAQRRMGDLVRLTDDFIPVPNCIGHACVQSSGRLPRQIDIRMPEPSRKFVDERRVAAQWGPYIARRSSIAISTRKQPLVGCGMSSYLAASR